MATSIQKRVEALEADVAALKRQINGSSEEEKKPSWLDIAWGAFANDPAYVEAMRLGAEWRKKENAKSLRRQKKKKRKNVRS